MFRLFSFIEQRFYGLLATANEVNGIVYFMRNSCSEHSSEAIFPAVQVVLGILKHVDGLFRLLSFNQ